MDNVKELLSSFVPREWMFSMLPTEASKQAPSLDALYYFLIYTCTGLFLFVVVPMVWFTIKYRRKHEDQKALTQKDHNIKLELIWSLLPVIYLTILFFWGFNLFLELYVAPIDAKELHVVGQKWQWSVQYTKDDVSVSGKGAVIGVVVDEPVKLTMVSQDVIHSFFIPNFRVKQDVLPGRYSSLWFTPTEIGEFPVLCAEYCGDQHSVMMATIKVMQRDDFNEWVTKIKSETAAMPPLELGKSLYVKKGCNACHTTDGTIKIGPSFKGLYDSKQELSTGGTFKIDENTIREHLLDPQKKVIKGYAPVMPTFRGQLSEVEIRALLEFIKSLKSEGKAL